jgi:hypothetical protein
MHDLGTGHRRAGAAIGVPVPNKTRRFLFHCLTGVIKS